jgi:phosphoglycolate phosphatase
MRLRGVIFDLDGTLLDTLGDIAAACNAALRRHGHPTHPPSAYKYFVGEGVTHLIETALPPDALQPEHVRAVMGDYTESYRARGDADTWPYAGVPELLDALAVRGLPAAVLSNKPGEFTERCVRERLAAWRFVYVAGAGSDVPRKPDPAGALRAAAAMGLAPEEIAFVGDTAVDMHTAVAAGMFPAGALWGFRDAAELLAAGARVLLPAPAELLTQQGLV